MVPPFTFSENTRPPEKIAGADTVVGKASAPDDRGKPFKSFPLTFDHPWAFRAASAGRCFYELKPELFLRWKSQVYGKQDELNVAALDSFAVAENRSEQIARGYWDWRSTLYRSSSQSSA